MHSIRNKPKRFLMLTTKQHIAGNEPEKEYSQFVSLEHRKKFAQFFTPFTIAQFMAKWITANKNLQTVLDPAFGLGIFARAIRQTNKEINAAIVIGVFA